MAKKSDTDSIAMLSKDELTEYYGKNKHDIYAAHRLWCLANPEIPINFSAEFVGLLERLEKLVELNGSNVTSPDVLLDSLIDSIYSDCRALFCENTKYSENYTLQNCLRITNTAVIDNAVTWINEIIDKKDFSDEIVKDYSFRGWVKFVTDKAVAHKDNLTEDEREKIRYKNKFLNNAVNVFEFSRYIFEVHCIYQKVIINFCEIELHRYNLSKEKT